MPIATTPRRSIMVHPRATKVLAALGCIAIASLIAVPMAMAHSYTSSTDFVHKASIAGNFEVESSKLALDKSQNPSVRDFAQRMIDDHTEAEEKLKSLLPTKTVDASAATDDVDDKHQKILDHLDTLSGRRFDNAYISAQKDAHKEAVSLFKDYAKHGDDAALKQFAQETLPTLKEHQQAVKNLK